MALDDLAAQPETTFDDAESFMLWEHHSMFLDISSHRFIASASFSSSVLSFSSRNTMSLRSRLR